MKTLILTAALSLLAANAVFANDAQADESPRCLLKPEVKQSVIPANPVFDTQVIEYDLFSQDGSEVDSEDDMSDEPAEVSGAFLVEIAPVDELANPVTC